MPATPSPPRPRTRPRTRFLLPALLLPSLATSCSDAGDPAPPRPHVILISVDTLRADHLSCYGYGRPTSPRLDRLAREGVLFERAFSTSSWTLPAHLSLLTGLPVSAHGVCDDRLWTRPGPGGPPEPVELRGTFLSELLRGAGYRTAGFYTWKYLEPTFGFGPGFEVYERLGHTFYSFPPVARRFDELRARADVKGLEALAAEHPELFDDTRPSSAEVVERALEWIDAVRAETPRDPFFCFLHLFDAHDPYSAPEPYRARFADPAYDGPINGRDVMGPGSPVHGDMAPADLAQLVALYDGEIAWIDAQIGRLLDELAARGLERDTLVVVTSDHGEEFYEHGSKQHRHALYVESVHVPWIARWPRGLPAGRRVPGAVGLVDVAPTIGVLAGLGPPPGASGRDQSGAARGERSPQEHTYVSELLVFAGGGAPERHIGLTRGARHAVLVARGTAPWRVERFDLDADPLGRGPGERFELSDPRGSELARRLDSARGELAAARARAPARLANEGAAGLDAADVGELSAVGYTGVDEPPPAAAGAAGRLCVDGCVWSDE